ncbi:MAG: 2-succinyl-5-enolpyruvyl-6-hydroxy-3-cyclohexene-1-carboxylic-acid synthase [Cyanobacteria bacterium J06623_4]
MPIDFRNTNSLWASVAAETLARLGLQTAILCPGSRSTPLTFAFAAHAQIETLPILDERSAAFFALGCAKRQHLPVALVCTSGTAGANFYPAVIEAYESGIPLLLLTADRPPELRHCGAGQTIDQQKLYGSFVKDYSELAVPAAEVDLLAYLRQALVSGWRQAVSGVPGPVHFNCPFRDPLPPLPDGKTRSLSTNFDTSIFFSHVVPPAIATPHSPLPLRTWQQAKKGLIIAGPATPQHPEAYCRAVSILSQQLGWPVLAEGLSPLRNYQALNPTLVASYDIILRRSERAAALAPDQVIQLGPLPISKVLRQWLKLHQPCRWIVGSGRNMDPLHGPTQTLTTELSYVAQQLAAELSYVAQRLEAVELSNAVSDKDGYVERWLTCEKVEQQRLRGELSKEKELVESKVVWLLSQYLPEETPLFIANSMPVRDVEYFWPPGDRRVQPVFSRGANGIDGTLSTAMGVAHRNVPAVLLTGDLAFLHDTNGLLNAAQLVGHLTVIVINNGGGGIFEMLPVAQFDKVSGETPENIFEKYFLTPQKIALSSLCEAYGVDFCKVKTVESLVENIATLSTSGVRVVEVICDRQQSVEQRKRLLKAE